MIRGARVSIRLALLLPVLFGLGSVGVVLAVSQLTRNEAGMFFKAAVIMLAIPVPAAWLAIRLTGRRNNQDVTVSSVASSIWLGLASWIALVICSSLALHHFQREPNEALFFVFFFAWVPIMALTADRFGAHAKTPRLRAAQKWTVRGANLLIFIAIAIPRLEPGPHQRLKFAAGWGARDCGAFDHSSYEDPDNDLTSAEIIAIGDCSRAALRSGKAMFFSVRLQGIDSYVATGLVRSANGSLSRLHYDRMSCDIVGFCGTYADFRPCPHDPKAVVDPLMECAGPSSETRDYSTIW